MGQARRKCVPWAACSFPPKLSWPSSSWTRSNPLSACPVFNVISVQNTPGGMTAGGVFVFKKMRGHPSSRPRRNSLPCARGCVTSPQTGDGRVVIFHSLTTSQAGLFMQVTIPLVVADYVSCAISHRIAIRLTHSVAPPLPNTTTLLGCVWVPWLTAPFAQRGLWQELVQFLSFVPRPATGMAKTEPEAFFDGWPAGAARFANRSTKHM